MTVKLNEKELPIITSVCVERHVAQRKCIKKVGAGKIYK